MKRRISIVLAGLTLVGALSLVRPAVAGPEQQGIDLSRQSLAVGDSVGRAIFDREEGKRTALPPKAVQERIEQRGAQAEAPPLPSWPAKWADHPAARDTSTY